jgi:hypothetical protein
MAALSDLAVDAGLEAAPSWVTQLETLASRHGMRELVATAAALRARLGEPQALDTASLVAQAVHNPALHRRLSAQRPGQLQR